MNRSTILSLDDNNDRRETERETQHQQSKKWQGSVWPSRVAQKKNLYQTANTVAFASVSLHPFMYQKVQITDSRTSELHSFMYQKVEIQTVALLSLL